MQAGVHVNDVFTTELNTLGITKDDIAISESTIESVTKMEIPAAAWAIPPEYTE
jgi:hypothetical protein